MGVLCFDSIVCKMLFVSNSIVCITFFVLRSIVCKDVKNVDIVDKRNPNDRIRLQFISK